MREHVLSLIQRYLPAGVRPGAGGNVLTKCPFHKGGEERKPSFSVNIEMGLFHCFTCHVAGDVRYLLKLLGLPRSLIDAEIKVIQPSLDEGRRRLQFERENFFSNSDPFKANTVLPEALLGIYEWCPSSLLEQGFDIHLLQDMEIGFDRNQHRITFPLRDLYGNLAGIAGGKTLPHQDPKYLVYQGGAQDTSGRWVPGDFGKWFDDQFPGFKCENHDYLWNYNRVYPRALMAESDQDSTVVLVEGYKACLWTIQSGFKNTVALMGSYISEKQQRLLHRLGGTIILFLDNDEAGRRAVRQIGKLLWRPLYGRIKVAQYPEEDVMASLSGEGDSQPDDYQPIGVQMILGTAVDFQSYMQTQPKPVRRSHGNQHVPS